jgi:hypothetical protein
MPLADQHGALAMRATHRLPSAADVAMRS